MKNLNWLVKLVFYQHTEKEARLPEATPGVFYEVGFMDQLHANLCTNASISMLNHFAGKPFASMTKNPRGIMDGPPPDAQDYQVAMILSDKIQTTLKNCGPFIMSLPLKYGVLHSVVVTGCTENQVIYNDPLTGAHKMIGIDVLNGLCSDSSEQVEIHMNRFVNQNSLAGKVKTMLPESPPNITPKHYQEFFSLDKMDDPCAAMLNFLKDYSKFSLSGLGRHHKKEVSELVERNQGKGLNDLLLDLMTTFPKDVINPKGELMKRLLTIEKIMNQEPAPEPQSREAPTL
ncbi:MAG: hypothetical protein ACHP65_02825 [Legionellales bacterium]